MRTILISNADESYLQKCLGEQKFTFGIIIGQQVDNEKDVVVHLAKNGEEEVELATISDESSIQGPQDVQDIDTQALAIQWVSAKKMISGCFEVIGMFVSGSYIDMEGTFSNAKKLLDDMFNIPGLARFPGNSLTTPGHNFSDLVDDDKHAEVTFLAYSANNRQIVAKSYTPSSNGGSFKDLDVRLVEKPFVWYSFESNFELDDIFPITAQKVNIEHQFSTSIEAVKKILKASETFIQNDYIDDALLLNEFIANKYGKNKTPDGFIRASIYLPLRCQVIAGQPVRVKECNGTIRFSGVISSRIWCNPENTIGNVKRFVRRDILRSMVARIQLYCEGLTATNVSSDTVFVCEPPRRIYFSLHTPPNESALELPAVQYSEYIFRGETATVAVAQAKQILDVDIGPEHICTDVEVQPDDEALSVSSAEGGLQERKSGAGASQELTRTMFMLSIAVSLLVMLLAVSMNYIFRKE